MSLRNVLLRAREDPPRSFLVAQRLADEGPVGRTKVSARAMSKRLEPILGLVADGTIPVDETLGKALGIAVERMWGEQNGS